MIAAADLSTALKETFSSVTVRATNDHAAINVGMDEVIPLLKYLRDELTYDILMDLTAIDWDKATPRFTVVYHLYSSTQHNYIRIAANCADDLTPTAPTATGLWAGADWHERECYDMFGITFVGHPDMRRILMWDGYPYFPLRKEFPLAGIETALPDVEVAAETNVKVKAAPMMGGPFVGGQELTMGEGEPRARDESWTERKEKP